MEKLKGNHKFILKYVVNIKKYKKWWGFTIEIKGSIICWRSILICIFEHNNNDFKEIKEYSELIHVR